MTSTPLLTVSLIVHGDFSHIGPALRSLYAHTVTPMQVYVTINTGADAVVDALRAEFPTLTLVWNEHPQGFAANHNAIMKLAATEFAALLNDDIVIHDAAVDRMVAYLQAHPEAGLVGPSLLNADGTPQVSFYSDPTLIRMLYKISGLAVLTNQQSKLRHWLRQAGVSSLFKQVISLQKAPTVPRPVPVIKGTAMVVRRTAYTQVGLMDETTVAYGEEIDWHWRLRQAGWQVVYVPQASVTHYGMGQATLKLHGALLTEDRHAILNYFSKHRPRWQTHCIRGGIILAHSFWGAVWLPFSLERARTHWRTARLGFRRVPANRA
ncbi:MAG: glycosyltransferase family 2 protein [Anaerolineae bacterium]|nr:glycosyltransferase family 2 protein [Anaerolineae bacterium]